MNNLIHINKGEEPHEWITREEFKKRYPDLYAELSRPIVPDSPGQKLREKRIQKRITIRKLIELSGLTASEICSIENGRIEVTADIENKYLRALDAR